MVIDARAIERLYERADAARWSLPIDVFAHAVNESVRRTFAGRETPRGPEIERHLASLHAADLALACACSLGQERAWDHFVRELRPVLYRAADALDPAGGAREIADSLYGELYGVRSAGVERRSLFRYFDGRSSLATWLRAVLAQRHVDAIRARRRTEPLPDEEAERIVARPADPDPERQRLVPLLLSALAAALTSLPVKERLRLRSYYAGQLTLAQIGRITGEHEATVSRQLARTRRLLRESVELRLHRDSGLGDAAIARSFELAVEDPGELDLELLFGPDGRKKPAADRSRVERP